MSLKTLFLEKFTSMEHQWNIYQSILLVINNIHPLWIKMRVFPKTANLRDYCKNIKIILYMFNVSPCKQVAIGHSLLVWRASDMLCYENPLSFIFCSSHLLNKPCFFIILNYNKIILA